MSFQSDFEAAGEEYARHLEKQREVDRLAALTIEARKAGNASAFALAFEAALAAQHDTDTQEIQ
ncbi:hypothetical protein [Nocardioides sp. URHA0032]|uniref:hypothetical protein n=1 Tax=Nocardioides sp. URHA0032 TaxID=1380388 RepID=UPI000490CC0F|nr:hypothetical protein [Nocardioides sp. URHA0032]